MGEERNGTAVGSKFDLEPDEVTNLKIKESGFTRLVFIFLRLLSFLEKESRRKEKSPLYKNIVKFLLRLGERQNSPPNRRVKQLPFVFPHSSGILIYIFIMRPSTLTRVEYFGKQNPSPAKRERGWGEEKNTADLFWVQVGGRGKF